MKTQSFMGRGQLIDRVTAQVGDRNLALKILAKRGHVYPHTDMLTSEGILKDNMTSEERALERSAKKSNKSTNNFIYNSITNKTQLK